MTTEPIAYLNGEFVPRSRLTIDAADAGFVYGATVTDFCRTYNQKLFRWDDHLQRLRHDCGRCYIPLVESDSELSAIAEELLKRNPANGQERAIITFATPGPVPGRSVTSGSRPTLGMQTLPIEAKRYQQFFDKGVSLEHIRTLMPNLISFVKHRSRLHWWIAQHDATLSNSVPMLGSVDGTCLDTAIGSVLMMNQEGELLIPELETVLDSISMRVVTGLCQSLNINVIETNFDKHDLGTAKEIMLAGSGFGLVGVSTYTVEGRPCSFDWPGPITRRLHAAWSELVGCDITLIPDPS